LTAEKAGLEKRLWKKQMDICNSFNSLLGPEFFLEPNGGLLMNKAEIPLGKKF
jgi:hypothetical protein